MDSDERGKLIGLVEEQRNIYKRMLNLVTQQADALKNGDEEVLMPLAEEVSSLKVASESLQGQIDPMRLTWSQNREMIPDDQRSQLKALTLEVQEILSNVLAAMNHLRENVDGSRGEIFDKLKKMSKGQAAQRGYGAFGKPPKPRFMDRNE